MDMYEEVINTLLAKLNGINPHYPSERGAVPIFTNDEASIKLGDVIYGENCEIPF